MLVTYKNRQGRKRQYMMAFEGIIAGLDRRYRETESSLQRERIEEYMTLRPCPTCNGARLKPESLAVTVANINIHTATGLSVAAARTWIDGLSLSDNETLIAERIVRELRERLGFLVDVGVGYLSLDRAAGDAVGRRGAAHPPRDADRLAPRRRAVHPRRAVDRPPPARQPPPHRHARRGCATSATP